MLNGILSAPAERKRQGIADVLESFPDSRFLLIGDSGEQDMELYASFARERPEQVLAIFIRDAGGDRSLPLNDPTGENGMFGWDPAAGVRTSSGYPEGTVTGSMTQQPAGESAPGIDSESTLEGWIAILRVSTAKAHFYQRC